MSISLVQQASGASSQVTTTFTVSLGSTPGAGNFLAAIVGAAVQDSVVSISGGGVTWQSALVDQSGPQNRGFEIWYGMNASGSGTTTITLTLTSAPGSGNSYVATVAEFSGVATTSAFDAADSPPQDGLSASPSTGNVVTANASDLLLGGFFSDDSNGASAPSNGFTALTEFLSGGELDGAYKVVSATGTYSVGWTITSSKWCAGIASFKAAGGAGVKFEDDSPPQFQPLPIDPIISVW